MHSPLTITHSKRGVTTLTLNRPQVHNAFNAALVSELTAALEEAGADTRVHAVVLTGAGPSFSAGADLNWMREMVAASENENRDDARRLAKLYRVLDFLPKPVVGRINGAALGGGVGLVACCDIAVGSLDAKFGLTEVKLGLVPATIGPYVVNAIGKRQARRLFLSAEIFDAAEAVRVGLLHAAVGSADLDEAIERQLTFILKNGPQALAQAKQVPNLVRGWDATQQERLDEQTSALIAALRISDEGQEGLSAFLEKRKPSWVKN